MASGYAPRWLRILHHVPFLFKKCPDGNYHWRFDRYCGCRIGEHIIGDTEAHDWHGGVYCFSHQREVGFGGLRSPCSCITVG